MGRARGTANRRLPRNLYYRHGYYSYKDPKDGREYGIGRDKWLAIAEAMRRNTTAEVTIPNRSLTVDEIVAGAVPCSAMCAIYFLIDADFIVYVGQSTNVYRRLAQHFAKQVIQFDRYFILPCQVELLDVLEAKYIAELRPAANQRLLVLAASL